MALVEIEINGKTEQIDPETWVYEGGWELPFEATMGPDPVRGMFAPYYGGTILDNGGRDWGRGTRIKGIGNWWI